MNCNSEEILKMANKTSFPSLLLTAYTGEYCDPYMELHKVDKNGYIHEGIPLSENVISELVSRFKPKEKEKKPVCGIIPQNMLYANTEPGKEKYIWWSPPRKREMFFTESLNIPDGSYHVPGVVYKASSYGLHIYAFKGNKPKDKLYNAPFFNTTNGSVCLGSANINLPDNPTFLSIIDYWEKRFWMSRFSHLGGSINPTKNNLFKVTLQSKDRFDSDELIPIKLTLKDLLK